VLTSGLFVDYRTKPLTTTLKKAAVALCRQHADQEETFFYDKHAKALWENGGTSKAVNRTDKSDNTATKTGVIHTAQSGTTKTEKVSKASTPA
jgi:hypothetical protein